MPPRAAAAAACANIAAPVARPHPDVTQDPLPPSLLASASAPAPVDAVDARFLHSLVGFNARMAALKIIGLFVPRMAQFGLRVVDFSILSLIHHNPGITSRQLCDALNLLPPNLVGKIGALEHRGLL